MELTKSVLATHVASTDPTHLYLQAIFLTRAGAVSTDGHRLLVAPFAGSAELAEGEVIAIGSDAAASLAKSVSGKGSFAAVDLEATRANGHVKVTTDSGNEISVPKACDELPRYEPLIPQDAPVATIEISAKYLADVATKLVAAVGGSRPGSTAGIGIKLEIFADESGDTTCRPVRMTCDHDGKRAWALVMPMRL